MLIAGQARLFTIAEEEPTDEIGESVDEVLEEDIEHELMYLIFF